MNRIVIAVTFALGLTAVAWVGLGFLGSNWLALAMTAVIAGVYLLGAFELRQFRAASASLAAALAEMPQPLVDLGDWLQGVPASLRNAVRLRVEGERVALPGPTLTPYLVGLLVMLGMLGTFLGMVVTFKGAVFALEGSTDLRAIRSALAEPIKGLGLSFGTSVAGVAASAMLGLLSAICRRERVEVARQLDSRIANRAAPVFAGPPAPGKLPGAAGPGAGVARGGRHTAVLHGQHGAPQPATQRAIAGAAGAVPPRGGRGLHRAGPRRRNIAERQPRGGCQGRGRKHPARGGGCDVGDRARIAAHAPARVRGDADGN